MSKIELNTPVELKRGSPIKNRFLKSATSEQLGDKHHNPRPALARAYRRWAKGGTGLSVSGNIMIDRTALGEPKNVVLDNQSDLSAFRSWTKAGTENDTHFWAQLNHPGKQSPFILSKQPVAPSAVSLQGEIEKGFNTPRALTEKEIWDLIAKYANAARLSKEVGFTGVQIHGAHGYLVSQFHSPRHNKRQDQWGGSIENRMRFVLEIYKAIREQVGDDFPIGIKLNSADFQKDGFTEEESMQVVKALSDIGIDHIEISGGTYESQAMLGSSQKESTKKREAYFLSYAEQVRKVTDVPLAVTGGFRTAAGMTEAVQSGATDMVGLARPIIVYPDIPNKAMADVNYEVNIKEPSTGFKTLDTFTMMGLVWFEEQIHMMGKGQEPNPDLSAWKAAWTNSLRMGGAAFKPRRA